MGDHNVGLISQNAQMQRFVKHLLKDVQALEYMLENDWIESDTIRIGAEQEMCLVDNKNFKPAPINMQVLEQMKEYDFVDTELARFNIETNLTPRVFEGDCLRQLELENLSYLAKIRDKLQMFDARIVLTGILPTLRKYDLDLHNLTPKPRYLALIEGIRSQMEGNALELKLSGIDELQVKHDSPLIEACNTSFQVHLQVAPKDFVKMYNISQALSAPVMAIAANSPIVFGRRLWHETRIALFQQALDTRSTHEHMREKSPRVNFGSGWLRNSIIELYKEDIARFRVLLGREVEEDSLKAIKEGRVPALKALQIHNGTVYRWNRACYGISDNGKPHLRIENRVLPSGPTVIDETANAAFWLGAMTGLALDFDDITKHIAFEDVRDNFSKAAKFGIDTKFTWLWDQKITAVDLVKQLLPVAQKGLESRNVNKDDIYRYLSIIEQRAEKHVTGARWQLRAYSTLKKSVPADEAISIMTASMVKNSELEKPVHEWELPSIQDLEEYKPSKLKVEEFMETDLYTVRKEDIIELVAEMMDWKKIRYTPVENQEGELIGLVTSRLLLRHFAKINLSGKKVVTVKDIMIKDPITITSEYTILEALKIMREKEIGCLPVVKGKELIGIITEADFLKIYGRLIDRLEK